jgi:hypothetical protein
MQVILTGGLAQCLRIAQRVAQIVGDLEGLADPGAKLGPGLCILARPPARPCAWPR